VNLLSWLFFPVEDNCSDPSFQLWAFGKMLGASISPYQKILLWNDAHPEHFINPSGDAIQPLKKMMYHYLEEKKILIHNIYLSIC
jgi:hypothetical protein